MYMLSPHLNSLASIASLRTTRILFVILIIVSVYVFFIPKSFLGEAFFGGVPPLYNTTLAQFFYTQSLRFDTKDGKPEPYIYYQLARIDFIKGNFDTSLDKLQTELKIFPDHTHTYYMLGLVYGYTGRERAGIDAFSKYIEYDPGTWAGRNDMAWLLFRIGDIPNALNTMSDAYQLYPDNPWVLNSYGVLLMNVGLLSEAHNVLTHGNIVVESLTPETWGAAYPGNDPRIYATGLTAMKISLAENLMLVESKLAQLNDSVDNKAHVTP
jgi:tetratricopeptide (TPR) repeat protein